MSTLDCFHPNRVGHKAIGQMTWNQVRGNLYAMGVYSGATGPGANDTQPTVDTVAPVVATGWTGSWQNNYSELRQTVPTARGASTDLSGDLTTMELWAQNYGYDTAYSCRYGTGCYLGKVRELNSRHDLAIQFVDPYGYPDDAGNWDYWRVNVKPQDAKGNGTSIFYGPWY